MREEQDRGLSDMWKAGLWIAAIVVWGVWLVRHAHRDAARDDLRVSIPASSCVAAFDPAFPELAVTRCADAPSPVASSSRDCKLVSSEVALAASQAPWNARRGADVDAANASDASSSVVGGTVVTDGPNAVRPRQGGSISLRITLGADGVIQGIHVEQSANCLEGDAEEAQA